MTGWLPVKPPVAPLPVEELAMPAKKKEEVRKMDGYRAATGRDLIDALTVAGLVTRYQLGTGRAPGAADPEAKIRLTDAGAALLVDPQSPVLGYVQIPGIFVKEEAKG